MCTAIAYQKNGLFFGRTLDHTRAYAEQVVLTPRQYPLIFRHTDSLHSHYAMLGMAHVADGYPLYYDALNEAGLCIAGLNFVGNAVYAAFAPSQTNVAQFELIPWLLGQCASVAEARVLLAQLNLTGTFFSSSLPTAQLHWLLADSSQSVTIESTAGGLQIYENPVGVLTNNPPFAQQLFSLNNYMHLSVRQPKNSFSEKLPLQCYSRGMGALGLPGDLSSMSRFVRAAFLKLNVISDGSAAQNVSQMFHILGAVEQPLGCCETSDGQYSFTRYSSCCDAARGIYYYTTYDNRQLTAVELHAQPLDADRLAAYPLMTAQQILWQNRF